MEATIKRIKDISGDTSFKVFKDDSTICTEIFWFRNKEEEASALALALKLAKKIEEGITEEKIIYKTGIEPIDYFLAANMTEEELYNHFKNIKP